MTKKTKRNGRKRKRKKTTSPTVHTLLALDVSSVCVGWAVFQNGVPTTQGKFHPKGKEHGCKLASFLYWLQRTFSRVTPTDIAVELPYPGRNRGYGILQMYFGILVAAHYRWRKCELPDNSGIPASQVKHRLKVKSGKSHGDNKQIMVNRINELYGLSLVYVAKDREKKKSQDDVADAIAVGRTWLLLYKPELVMNPDA
jgi:hypothetical protein